MSESQAIISAAAATETITDALGRELQVRRTDKREVRRLIRISGAAADVERWFGEAVIALQVRAIDGVPVPFPTNPNQVDDLVVKLDDAGLTAVVDWVSKTPSDDGHQTAKN